MQMNLNPLSSFQATYLCGGNVICNEESWKDAHYIPAFNKFYLVRIGECVCDVDGTEYLPKAGQLMLMPENHVQSYCMSRGKPLAKHWCHFTAHTAGRRLFDVLQTDLVVTVPDFDGMAELFVKIHRPYAGDNNRNICIEMERQAALIQVISTYIALANPRYSDNLIHLGHDFEPVFAYIRKNLSVKFSVEDLSKTVHLHPNYFIKRFHDAYGCSPMQYVNTQRIEQAKSLLKTTELSMAQITEKTGFGDVSYFSKYFKKAVGFTPSLYRSIRDQ
ncbi:MAG: hypothetical protein BGN88_12275 [Clostridiales bacterium 43-6]|nr:MAG: hypothetical protein BGN88_12275 [Clostridiales bacterium 43-6]